MHWAMYMGLRSAAVQLESQLQLQLQLQPHGAWRAGPSQGAGTDSPRTHMWCSTISVQQGGSMAGSAPDHHQQRQQQRQQCGPRAALSAAAAVRAPCGAIRCLSLGTYPAVADVYELCAVAAGGLVLVGCGRQQLQARCKGRRQCWRARELIVDSEPCLHDVMASWGSAGRHDGLGWTWTLLAGKGNL